MRLVATPRSCIAGILVGGVAAGILDIVYAFVLTGLRGGTPLRVLQSVASGVLGSSAYQGSGAATGTLGLALHIGITIVAAAVYYVAARRSTLMRDHYLAAGSLFGALVYLFMNFVVLPLSAVPFETLRTPAAMLQGFVSHALLVGIPIAWSLHRFSFEARPLIVKR